MKLDHYGTQTTVKTRNLIEHKFSRLETRLVAVEHQLQCQNDNFVNLITKVEETANSALSLVKTNAASITETNEKGECNKFEIDQLKVKVSDLFTEVNELRDELDDCQNRSIGKTLIFKNIPINSSKSESWNESKAKLVQEIKKVMANYSEEEIASKIERAHRSKENHHKATPAIIAKITVWLFSEEIKSQFIKARSAIIVTQMYTPALTSRKNNAIKKRKELREEDDSIQAYVKYPAILMVKKAGDKKYKEYAEY